MLENMVQKKRQDHGLNGFHVPFVPRAPRSARRGLHTKKLEDSQICAFDLLASIAGKLLQENESSSASSNASQTKDHHSHGDDVVKTEQHEDRLLKEESVYGPPIAPSGGEPKCILEKSLQAESDSILEHSSEITNSDSSEKVCSDLKSTVCKRKISGAPFHCKVGDSSPVSGDYKDVRLKDSVNLCKKFPASINSDSNVELQSRRDPIPNASIITLKRNDSKLGIRDDDENYSRYNKSRAYRYPSRVGERRLRKFLASKCWKVSPKLKDSDLSKAAYFEGGVKPFYRKRKICYGRERYQHASLYKRRKFSENSLVVNSDGVLSSESVCNSPQNGIKVNKNCSENGAFSSVKVHQTPSQSKDSHVKFSIKSFRIPELFIEAPENATVGSLKRTVMETVTAILGGRLQVGVLLHGKKIRDDNRTLLQTGITSEQNLDTLGFTLEPCTTVQPPPPTSIEASPVPISPDNSQLILRPAAAPVSTDPPLPPNSDSNKLGPSSPGKTLPDSRALVAVPPVSAEALAVVPVNQKARRSELVQRRTRRPFSVTEVEALVEAVEELGTGRWRDVKLRSFENADHRTYVDLKDKWKTLVHTAKIAPQQRRGEPVPQELLDRVLAAHAYWLQHNNSKNQGAVVKIPEARNGVEGI